MEVAVVPLLLLLFVPLLFGVSPNKTCCCPRWDKPVVLGGTGTGAGASAPVDGVSGSTDVLVFTIILILI